MLRLVVDSVAQRTDAIRSWERGNLSLRFALTPLHGTRRFGTSVVAEIRSHPIVRETCDPNVERCVGEGYVILMQVSEPILRSDGQLTVMASLSGDDSHRGDPSKGFAISWTVLLHYDGDWRIDGIEMTRISAP